LGDGYMQHAQIDGINLDNIGGNGFQASGDATGRVQLSNINVKNAVGSPVILAVSHSSVRGAILENWNTGAIAGAAGIVGSATSDVHALQIDDVIAIHTDNTKSILNLAALPRLYQVHNVVSPSGNPRYDTVNGINPGADNVFVGSLASLTRGPTNVSKLSQLGHLERFTLPSGLTMTFTFEAFACEFIVSANTGKAAKFFAEQTTAALTVVANPGAQYENSSTPAAGNIGVFKSAAARVISIKNNVGGDIDIGIQTLGGAITAITDPA
jgi:hypothetical protein